MRRIALLCLSALLACSSGKSAQLVPAAPANVGATAGDGQVTVLWDPVAGAVSYALYTADGAAAAARTDVGAATSWTAVGLTNGHSYRFSVSAVGVSGEGARSAEVTATPAVNLPLAVAVMPADAAASVARNATITLAFNKGVTASTVTTGSACTGSVLLSFDSFNTCAPLVAAAGADGKTFTVSPAQPLKGATAFKLRVTKAVKDANGIALAAEFNSAFTTSAQLTATISVNNALPLRPVFSVNFNRPALAASITYGPACSGAVRLSADNFATCVVLAHSVASGVDTFTSTADLAAGTSFLFQVAGLKDSDGVAFTDTDVASFTTPAAFAVSSITPADGTLAGSLDPAVVLVFSAPIDISTLTLSTSGTGCAGSLQISADSFATCVALTAPAFDQGNQRVTTRPAANLAAGLYQVKVTTAVHTLAGLALAAESLTTFAAGPGPTVVSTTPADGAQSVSRGTTLTIVFDKVVTGVATNSGAATCTGTVQLAAINDVTNCLPLEAAVSSAGGSTFTIRPSSALAGSLTYQFNVSGAKDINRVPMGVRASFTFATEAALTVTNALPGAAATGVARRPPLSLTFSRGALGVTTSQSTSCGTSTLQLSSSATFNSCVPLSAVGSGPLGSVQVSALADLAPNSIHYWRLLTAGVSDGNYPLAAPFGQQFTTGPAVSVATVVPADGATSVLTSAAIQLTFTSAVAVSSVTSRTDCSGSVQISGNDFNGCAAVSITTSPDGRAFTFTPAAALAPSTIYQVRMAGVTDPSGAGLIPASFLSRFITGPVLVVSSTSPAATATGVARNATPSFTFNKPVKPSTVIGGAAGACAGTVQLSTGGSCLAVAPTTADAITFTLSPGLLTGSTTYTLSIAGVHDVNDVPMGPPQTFTFTTAPALTLTARTPAPGSTNVSVMPTLTVNFSRAAANLTTGGASCQGQTFQLFKDSDVTTCLQLTAASASNGGTTWSATPATALTTVGAYRLVIRGTVTDSDGVALGADDSWTFTSDGSVNGSPPNVQVNATPHANSVDLSWTSPGGSFAGVHIYVKAAGAANYPTTYATATSSPFTLPLTAGGSYDLLIKSFNSSGIESSGTEVTGIATAFTGTSADFLSGQTAPGVAGGSFFQGWTDNEFLAGFTLANGQTLGTANGDALWIGFSTTAATVEVESPTSPNGGSVIWPFFVDWIVEVKNTPGGLVENLRNVASGGWCSSTDASCPLHGAIAATISGSIVEVRFNKSAIGSPTTAKVAMIAVATHSGAGDTAKGYVFDLAPASLSAIDTFGTWGSLTSAYAPGANIFNSSKGTATTGAVLPAPALVSFSVSNTAAFNGPDVKIKGSKHPFSYDLPASTYQLDLSTDKKTASGTFNLGGQQGELFFKFNDHGTDEPNFTDGKDRIFALGSGPSPSESVPSLAWSTAGATSFTLDFVFATGGNPTGVGGDRPELGSYNPASAAGPVVSVNCADFSALLPAGFSFAAGNPCYLVTVSFPAGRDFVTAPLNFKAVYDKANFEDPAKTHVMDDDVINHRYLFWNAGDFTTNY